MSLLLLLPLAEAFFFFGGCGCLCVVGIARIAHFSGLQKYAMPDGIVLVRVEARVAKLLCLLHTLT